MRELIIEAILGSRRWQACLDNGLEDELPDLNNLSHVDLLDCYDFYVNGMN